MQCLLLVYMVLCPVQGKLCSTTKYSPVTALITIARSFSETEMWPAAVHRPDVNELAGLQLTTTAACSQHSTFSFHSLA